MGNDLSEAAKREVEVEAEKRAARVKAQAMENLGAMLVEHLGTNTNGISAVYTWSTPIETLLKLRKLLREAGQEKLAMDAHALIMSRVKE